MTTPAIELKSRRLLLRPYSLGNGAELFEAVCEWKANPTPWLRFLRPDYAQHESDAFIEQSIAAWEKGTEYNFSVCEAATGRLLGGCGLNQIDRVNGAANLGYWVRYSELGKGVAPEATRLLARHALESLEMNRVEIVISVKNLASQRAAEKAGAVREGIARARLKYGTPHDAVIYSFTTDDLPRLTAG